jgi:hypothetical protein
VPETKKRKNKRKPQNLGFEASNPKRKKERKTSLKPWTSFHHPTWATSGYETHARSFTGFLLDHMVSRMVKKNTLLTNPFYHMGIKFLT